MRGLYRMSLRQVFNFALVAIAGLVWLPGRPSARAGNDPLTTEVQAVFQRCAKAVVKIEADDDSGKLSGTGFFVDPNGTIYTNYSVGGESRDIVVSDGVARYPATRVAADPRSGLAILKIEAQKTPFLTLGKSSGLSVATMVMTVGYPLDLPLTPSVGCVGGFGISVGNRFFVVSHIRANVAVQDGEGGAPLLDMYGQVVGVIESSLNGGAGCFVLPIEAAEKVQGDVMRFGDVRPGWLGIRFDNSGDDPSRVEVQGFVEGSPAAQSGIKPGDQIVQVGNRKITSIEDVMDAAFYLTAGDEVPLTIAHGGQNVAVKVVSVPNPMAPQTEVVPVPAFGLSVRVGNGR